MICSAVMAKANSELFNQDLVSPTPGQGWGTWFPAPELSISSSTPMHAGPISSRPADARHVILTYASCCAATDT